MSRTPSTMLDIGTRAPDFNLPDPLSGNSVKLSNYEHNPLLVVFSCNHCPYVLHLLQSFSEYAREIQKQGLSVVMINANDIENYPQDSPENMIELAQQYGFEFPYLYDASQQVAIGYQAACTPDFFLFDASHRLVYRGQYDAARPGNDEAVTGVDLRAASQALLNSAAITAQQMPSMGCNIKWRAGNEPQYS
ncbi:MAG: thioredoxin family protein [Gammaproteobacteria bacterium]|nr:thioredoxin family protein [Gammaproteobacteria bacterium]MCZ6881476.1 thioredoxin family protein [Gammaproteobacteria bacterium]